MWSGTGFFSQVCLNLDLVSSSADSPPAAARPPPSLSTAVPDSSADPQHGGGLVSVLSKVDMSPADLLNALSKVQGLDSLDGKKLVFYVYDANLMMPK